LIGEPPVSMYSKPPMFFSYLIEAANLIDCSNLGR
jgi:hypothetical protein